MISFSHKASNIEILIHSIFNIDVIWSRGVFCKKSHITRNNLFAFILPWNQCGCELVLSTFVLSVKTLYAQTCNVGSLDKVQRKMAANRVFYEIGYIMRNGLVYKNTKIFR
jgi:hypothetical protein